MAPIALRPKLGIWGHWILWRLLRLCAWQRASSLTLDLQLKLPLSGSVWDQLKVPTTLSWFLGIRARCAAMHCLPSAGPHEIRDLGLKRDGIFRNHVPKNSKDIFKNWKLKYFWIYRIFAVLYCMKTNFAIIHVFFWFAKISQTQLHEKEKSRNCQSFVYAKKSIVHKSQLQCIFMKWFIAYIFLFSKRSKV